MPAAAGQRRRCRWLSAAASGAASRCFFIIIAMPLLYAPLSRCATFTRAAYVFMVITIDCLRHMFHLSTCFAPLSLPLRHHCCRLILIEGYATSYACYAIAAAAGLMLPPLS